MDFSANIIMVEISSYWGRVPDLNKLCLMLCRYIGESDRAQGMEGLTVFEAKSIGTKRRREGKGEPGDVDGYKGPWREYVDQVKVAKPSDEEKAALELMFAHKKKAKKEEEETVEESSLLHSKGGREGGRTGGTTSVGSNRGLNSQSGCGFCKGLPPPPH